VVGYDYRGYGCSTFKESSGLKVSEESVNEDLEAVYAYTVLCHGITPTNVFLFGRSLGSSPSAHLASILTCSNPGLNLAKLACVQHTKIFERIRRHAGDSMKTPLLGGLVLQSAMKVSEQRTHALSANEAVPLLLSANEAVLLPSIPGRAWARVLLLLLFEHPGRALREPWARVLLLLLFEHPWAHATDHHRPCV
jgi:pimeloyl-ACP methyl ester carboxylesterase